MFEIGMRGTGLRSCNLSGENAAPVFCLKCELQLSNPTASDLPRLSRFRGGDTGKPSGNMHGVCLTTF